MMVLLEILAMLVLLLITLLLVIFILPNIFGAPYVPTRQAVARQMFELAGLRAKERVVDFGCGDGSLLITAAKEFGANGIGYDHNPMVVLLGKLHTWRNGLAGQVQIRYGNFYKVKMPPADVVACYLFAEVQAKLEARLIEAYPSGTRVVSHDFQYPSLKLEKQKKFGRSTIYLYRIP